MKSFMLTIACLGIWATTAPAQFGDSDLKIFGYFQNNFYYRTNSIFESERTSFSLQQLNAFMQKDIGRNWRAFINFEIINTFSSSRRWGAFNLEEAWARYSSNEKFNLKLGLSIPTFNNLNEIKNRTPLLPYIVRPLVYETSFSEFLPLEEYAPARAFVQAYGFFPSGNLKFDYAVYIGNSPNIVSRDPSEPLEQNQSGVDSTTTFLIGGRLGVRIADFKAGLSITRDNVNLLHAHELELFENPERFKEVPRMRYGGDLSFHAGRLYAEGEFILLRYDIVTNEIALDSDFFYFTIGLRLSEKLFVYGGYWDLRQHFTMPDFQSLRPQFQQGESDIDVPNFGISYNVNDRIKIKAQYAYVALEQIFPALQIFANSKFNNYSTAISVFF